MSKLNKLQRKKKEKSLLKLRRFCEYEIAQNFDANLPKKYEIVQNFDAQSTL